MKILLTVISILLLLLVIFKRADILAVFAANKYYSGKKEKGLKLFKISDKIGTLSPQNSMRYGYALLRVGLLDEARKKLNLAYMTAKKEPLKKSISSVLALVFWKDGDLDGAINLLEDVLQDFKNTAVYQNLGLMYVLKGNAEKALKFNLEAYDFNSDDLIIKDNLAESYVLSGDIRAASKLYEEILEKEPHFPEPYYQYGTLLFENGEEKRGIELIEKSLTKTFTFLSENPKEYVENLLEEKLRLQGAI